MAKKTLADLARHLKEIEEEIIKEGPKIAMAVAQDGSALAIQRVQKEGIEGRQYSTKPIFATQSMFNQKDKFEPTQIASTLGRDAEGNLVKGGVRKKKGGINKKKVEKRVMFLKFKGASKAVPVMILPGGYKELRQIQGLPVNFVDLTYSGRMFQNIGVLKTSDNDFKFLAFIGAKQQEEKTKLSANAKRYGPFLDPTPKEQEILSAVPLERIRMIFDKVFKK